MTESDAPCQHSSFRARRHRPLIAICALMLGLCAAPSAVAAEPTTGVDPAVPDSASAQMAVSPDSPEAESAEAGAGRTICHSEGARSMRVQTSTRKSYVALQTCFVIHQHSIQPMVKWTNTQGSLGCFVGMPPAAGCSLDAFRLPVDFNDIRVEMTWAVGLIRRTVRCPIEIGVINRGHNGWMVCPTLKKPYRGVYSVRGTTEFDVKHDGDGYFRLSSGEARRTF